MPLPVGFRLIVLMIKNNIISSQACTLFYKKKAQDNSIRLRGSPQTYIPIRKAYAPIGSALLVCCLLFYLRVVISKAIEQICLHLMMLRAKVIKISQSPKEKGKFFVVRLLSCPLTSI